jgi:anti-sigma regulatory factor (Ser/Thr protein kinase)
MELETLASLAPDRQSPREARRVVRHLLDGSDDEIVDGVLLAVSELATNAVLHARTPFEVRAGLDAGVLRIEVHDDDPTLPQRRQPSPEDIGGRGLLLVEQAADRWGVDREVDDGKTIWFELALDRRQGAA